MAIEEAEYSFSGNEVEEIVDHALFSLLWSEGEIYDEMGETTLESWDDIYDYSDATPELRKSIRAEIVALDQPDVDDAKGNAWRNAAHAYIAERGTVQFGHDMTLTRNGHGAGFWDRGAGEVGELLTEWAKSLGTLYVFHGGEAITELSAQWEGKFHAE